MQVPEVGLGKQVAFKSCYTFYTRGKKDEAYTDCMNNNFQPSCWCEPIFLHVNHLNSVQTYQASALNESGEDRRAVGIVHGNVLLSNFFLKRKWYFDYWLWSSYLSQFMFTWYRVLRTVYNLRREIKKMIQPHNKLASG